MSTILYTTLTLISLPNSRYYEETTTFGHFERRLFNRVRKRVLVIVALGVVNCCFAFPTGYLFACDYFTVESAVAWGVSTMMANCLVILMPAALGT